LIPWLLHRVVDRLGIRSEVETLINIPTTMLIGIGVVIFSFNLARPIAQLSTTLAGGTLGIALASVLLSFLMMITRAKAVPQVVGFLAMENGLFFAATSATYGMPMVVELGIALDVLIGVLILGVFMFQIREQFDSLDIRHLERTEGGLRCSNALALLLAIPLLGGVVLGLVGHRDNARDVNVAFSAAPSSPPAS
jgi:hydrogenase-4 component E